MRNASSDVPVMYPSLRPAAFGMRTRVAFRPRSRLATKKRCP